jgi:glycosyltransferase involved in cell wall biosynthesis
MARISAGLGLEHRLLGQRAQAVEGLLETKTGTYDVVLADETLAFVPPGLRYDRRYVIYTDNTFALSRRFYPQWLGPSARENDRLETYERRVFRSAHAVCCMSEFAAQSAIGDYGCERKRVRVVGGGTSFVPLDAAHRLPQPTALFVGLDFEVKGGSTLLAAWEKVQAQLPDAQLWIVGPPARRSTASIRWFGRISDRGTLRSLFLQASVFAIPSRFEAFGIACIEAMMHGLPVVATRCCAFPELISVGETGILVEVGSSDQLAEALCVLLSDLPTSRAMGLKAHAAVANSMTWDHVADRMMPALS